MLWLNLSNIKALKNTSKQENQAKHQRKLRMQLTAKDTVQEIDDIDLPGFKLHPLKGDRDGIWSITVNGN